MSLPLWAAMWSGNNPVFPGLLASAFWERSSSTISSCPFFAASYRAVAPSAAWLLMSAPAGRQPRLRDQGSWSTWREYLHSNRDIYDPFPQSLPKSVPFWCLKQNLKEGLHIQISSNGKWYIDCIYMTLFFFSHLPIQSSYAHSYMNDSHSSKTHTHTITHTDRKAIRRNLGFNILTKDTLTCRQKELGIEPLTLQ